MNPNPPIIANPMAELSARRDSILQTINKLTELNGKLTYQSIERVNSVALFDVKVKHPQQVTVELGAGYFAEITTNQAISLYQRRLKNLEAEIASRTKEGKGGKYKNEERVEGKGERPVGMVKSGKLQQGGKRGYMQVIGEENGEEIFNIVEIQGEEDEEYHNSMKKPDPAVAAPPVTVQTAPSQPQQQSAEQKEDVANSNVQKNGGDSEASFQKSEDEEQAEKSQKSGKSNQSDNEPQDLIQYHRRHIIGIKPTTPNSTAHITSPSTKSEGILPLNDTASPNQTDRKKKKRVSFADQRDGGKLEQMLKEEEGRRENKAKKEQSAKAKQAAGQVKQVKEGKQGKQGKQVKVQKGSKFVAQPVAGKVSKFKLQRMKQRQQRQGK